MHCVLLDNEILFYNRILIAASIGLPESGTDTRFTSLHLTSSKTAIVRFELSLIIHKQFSISPMVTTFCRVRIDNDRKKTPSNPSLNDDPSRDL